MNPSGGARPPRLAEALLHLALPPGGIRETVLGDLEELFLNLVSDPESGLLRARRWYWKEAGRLAVGYSLRRLRGRRFGYLVLDAGPSVSPGYGVRRFGRQVGIALRSLRRSPGFTVPVLVILAIGMTAGTTVFTVLDSVVLRPLAYPESQRLVLLCEEHPRMGGACVASPANTADLATASSSLSEVGVARGRSFSILDDRGRHPVRGGLATAGFFRALGARPQHGRLFTDAEVGPDKDKVVLLSHSLWAMRYGSDPAVVGRRVVIEGEPVVVVGILPSGFEAPLDLVGVQAWLPPAFRLTDAEVRGWRGWRTVARLADGVSLEGAEEELSALYSGLALIHEEINEEWRLTARPLLHVVLGDTRPVLFAFMAAAGILLLIVCANVANLVLVRGVGRRRELSVRAVLGAGRRQLVGEILVEGLVLAAIASLFALVLSAGAARVLVLLAPPDMPRLSEVAMDGRILVFSALLSIVVTAVFAVPPAMRVTGWDLANTIKSGAEGALPKATDRLRRALIVGELALSMMLLVAAALMLRSFERHRTWEPGFDRERLVAVSVFYPLDKYETRADLLPAFRESEARLRAVPGVASVASTSAGPLFGGGDGETPFATTSWDLGGELPTAAWFDVGPGYFETLDLPLVEGREFRETDELGMTEVVVVNETLARMAWPGERAVGQMLELPERGRSLEVVGVVRDIPPALPGASPRPEMYWSNRQAGRWATYMLLRTSQDPAGVAAGAAGALLAFDSDLSVGQPRTLAALEDRLLVTPRFQAVVLLFFAVTALILSAVGVYAVVSYSMERRVREIGIRVAVGATDRDVFSLVVKANLRLVTTGVAIGLGGAVLMGPLLEGMVHGVGTLDPSSLAVALMALAGAATLASLVPARRALRSDPVEAIRAD